MEIITPAHQQNNRQGLNRRWSEPSASKLSKNTAPAGIAKPPKPQKPQSIKLSNENENSNQENACANKAITNTITGVIKPTSNLDMERHGTVDRTGTAAVDDKYASEFDHGAESQSFTLSPMARTDCEASPETYTVNMVTSLVAPERMESLTSPETYVVDIKKSLAGTGTEGMDSLLSPETYVVDLRASLSGPERVEGVRPSQVARTPAALQTPYDHIPAPTFTLTPTQTPTPKRMQVPIASSSGGGGGGDGYGGGGGGPSKRIMRYSMRVASPDGDESEYGDLILEDMDDEESQTQTHTTGEPSLTSADEGECPTPMHNNSHSHSNNSSCKLKVGIADVDIQAPVAEVADTGADDEAEADAEVEVETIGAAGLEAVADVEVVLSPLPRSPSTLEYGYIYSTTSCVFPPMALGIGIEYYSCDHVADGSEMQGRYYCSSLSDEAHAQAGAGAGAGVEASKLPTNCDCTGAEFICSGGYNNSSSSSSSSNGNASSTSATQRTHPRSHSRSVVSIQTQTQTQPTSRVIMPVVYCDCSGAEFAVSPMMSNVSASVYREEMSLSSPPVALTSSTGSKRTVVPMAPIFCDCTGAEFPPMAIFMQPGTAGGHIGVPVPVTSPPTAKYTQTQSKFVDASTQTSNKGPPKPPRTRSSSASSSTDSVEAAAGAGAGTGAVVAMCSTDHTETDGDVTMRSHGGAGGYDHHAEDSDILADTNVIARMLHCALPLTHPVLQSLHKRTKHCFRCLCCPFHGNNYAHIHGHIRTHGHVYGTNRLKHEKNMFFERVLSNHPDWCLYVDESICGESMRGSETEEGGEGEGEGEGGGQGERERAVLTPETSEYLADAEEDEVCVSDFHSLGTANVYERLSEHEKCEYEELLYLTLCQLFYGA